MRLMSIRWCVQRFCLETLLDGASTSTTSLRVTPLKVVCLAKECLKLLINQISTVILAPNLCTLVLY